MRKAVIDFSSYPGAELLPVGQTVSSKMTEFALVFPDPPVTMIDFAATVADYGQKLQAKSNGGKDEMIAFEIARHELETDLGKLGNFVNSVANGDPAIVAKSGFPSYDTVRVPDPSPPLAPQNLIVRQGVVSGSFVVRYRPDRGHSINEVQINVGDPNNESDWKMAGLFSGGKAHVNGIVPGTTVWIRVRTVGLKGIMGAWSDPGKIMVV